MDLEKKYNDALERAKRLRDLKYQTMNAKRVVEEIFPELAETKDERIRKELIEFIKWSVDRHFMREDFHQAKKPSEWLTWLEKQKEPKQECSEKGMKGPEEDLLERLAKFYPTLDYTFRCYMLQDFPELKDKVKDIE